MVDIDRSKTSGRPPGSGPRKPTGEERRTVFSLSEEETLRLGRVVAGGFKGGELILLEGDLGLGKTVFAKGIAEGLGISRDEVTSPSFTIVQEYEGGRFPMFHVDLYRIEGIEEISTLGVEEILAGGGIVVVEWGDKLPPYLRRDAITVRFRDVGEGSRQIEILPSGSNDPTPHSDA